VRVRSDNPFVVTLAAMLRKQSHIKASVRTALKLPQLSPYSLLTLALLVSIATVDIVLTPTLHVGVFLYPVSILTALWWGGESAVLYVTGLAFILTVFDWWSHRTATYNIESMNPLIGTTNRLTSLLLLVLFGSACVWIARQQARYVHAQESLTDLEAKLTSVVQLTPDALILANEKGNIVFWNSSAVKMFGYAEEEALGQPLTLIMPSRYQDSHLQGLRRVCETGETRLIGRPVEVNGLRKDNTEFPLELSVATWETKGTRFFSAFLHDLTERKRMETRQAVQLAISQVLMDAETVEQAGSRILQAVGQLTDWEVGLIWLLDQRTETLRCTTVWEKSTRQALDQFIRQSQVTTFESGVGLPGRVFASGEPSWITNVVKDGNFPRLELAREADLHAAFGFPIKGSQGVLGVIEFFVPEVRPPDTSLLHTFADIGIKVGQFVERKQKADETAALVRELQAMTSGTPAIRGLLPICATCKRIRDPKGSWQEIELFIEQHSSAHFSHTICGVCARQAHPNWDTA
jgi:PAS domain S-box-containing protein